MRGVNTNGFQKISKIMREIGRRAFSSRGNWQWLIPLALALAAAPAGAETLVANFADASGTVTADQYSGLVLVTVSGSGHSLGTDLNDAFYLYTGVFANAPHNDVAGGFYQLEITKGSSVSDNPADDAVNQIVYDVDAGIATGSPYLPAYRSDHTYSFIIDAGSRGFSWRLSAFG
jgi:hypothetical protein